MTVANAVTLRAYRGPEDVPALVSLWNAMAVADDLNERRDVAQLSAWYRIATPHFDPWHDILIAEVDGVPRGWLRHSWVDTSDGVRDHRVWVFLPPDGHALMPVLQDAGEARAAEVADAQGPLDRDRILSAFAMPNQRWRADELERRGYTIVRWGFEMLRPTLDGIEPVPLPDGLEIRPASGERDAMKRLWDADIEAFRDHWGGFDGSDEAFGEWLEEPNLDPSLFVVAWDGDEIAGAVLNVVDESENRELGVQRGWLDSVFVRRPWRRRGLGAALVARSLAVLRDRGLTSAILGVDAENPTGALGLYERAGFRELTREAAYRRSWRPAAQAGR